MTAGDNLIVQAARRWIGTPYVHQASCLGAGCDCLGLVRGVWRDCFGAEPEQVPAYTPDWSEATGRELLLAAGRRLMVPVDPDTDIRSGQILLFRMRDGAVAKHLGITSDATHFIHAYDGCGVIETALTAPWTRRIAARFRFPD